MSPYKLNKTVLSIRKNPAQFLNGITSNTLDKPRNAFLNIHGRIVAVFDQTVISENEVWIVIEQEYRDKLLVHLDRYIKLSGVEINPLEKDVYYCQEGFHEMDGFKRIAQKKGSLIIGGDVDGAIAPDDRYTLLRLKARMPQQGLDFTDDFVLNVDEEEYVSFTKGCFLGQEPVSKVHNRSKPTWKLVVKYEDECDDDMKMKMTSKVLDPDTKRVLGFTFIKNR